MRKVWGRRNSSNVMKVIWLLEELALPYEQIDVGGPFGRTADPDYVAMNPNSVIPTLEEADGFTLWESNVILRYLAAVHAASTPLWPQAPQVRANIDRWMDWQQTILGPPATTVFQGLVRTAPEHRNMADIEAGMIKLGRAYTLLDAQIARHDYIAGPEFTLADIPVAVHAHRWFCFTMMRPELPHLRAWYERMLERPAFRKNCAAPMT